jgi:Domain of unknown function (DUF222)/HNH endonuclease
MVDWAVDTWAAVGAEVAAALRTSLGMAGSYLHYARVMWERLPAIAALFRAGDIDFRMFQTLVYRTDMIKHPAILVRVDAELAVAAVRWPSLTRGRLAAAIDAIVGGADPDAVRRVRERARGREASIWGIECGLSEVSARLFATDAALLDQRLDALADAVCAADPRTREERRADALGALAAGAQRLGCQCKTPECGAGSAAVKPVVIHVVAEQSALAGRGRAAMVGGDGLIPAELVVELAKTARLAPVVPPAEAEAHYVASRRLADFVRCRDLTCRAPGCDRPATESDIDHTVPYADGGATHPSNLKCLCRLHHRAREEPAFDDRADHQQHPIGARIRCLPGLFGRWGYARRQAGQQGCVPDREHTGPVGLGGQGESARRLAGSRRPDEGCAAVLPDGRGGHRAADASGPRRHRQAPQSCPVCGCGLLGQCDLASWQGF